MAVRDRDRGFRAVTKAIGRAAKQSRQRLRVGVFGDEEVARRALFHELGTSTIPQRSFIRSWVDENRAQITSDLRLVGLQIIRGADRSALLLGLGEEYAKGIQDKILSNIPPPLKPETVARKGHDLALVDTGEMISSIGARLTK